MQEQEHTLNETARILKVTNPVELPEKATAIVNETRNLIREVESLTAKLANSQITDIFAGAKEINGIKIVSAMLTDVKPDALRSLGDQIRDDAPDVIALLAGVNGESGNFCCVCSKSAVAKGAHAGKIIQRVAAITGGKGGGRPDSAMGSIGKSYMVDEALSMLQSIAGEFLK
jgi:alanyl-tRNA synthetase